MGNSYLKKVATLVSGTVFAQMFSLGIYPLLTRLFDAEQFALFGVFLSITSPLAIFLTLRYEASIALPKKPVDSLHLWAGSLLLAAMIALLCFIITSIFSESIISLFSGRISADALYLVPLGAFTISLFQATTYLGISKSAFVSISKSKVVQSVTIGLSQIALSVVFFDSLLYGFILGQVFASAYLIYVLKPDINKVESHLLKHNGVKYIDYPKYNALPSFIDTFTLQLPVLLIATGSDFAVAGFFTLVFRILAAPSAVIGHAIGQVYLKEIADRLNSGSTSLADVVFPTLIKLVILAILSFTPVVFFGEELFGFAFGEEWKRAGEYAEIIVFAIAARFIVSPLSTILGVTNHLKLGAIWKVLYFLSSFVILSLSIDKGTEEFIFWFVVNELVMYGLYLCVIWYASVNIKVRNV
ncbi:hypothetical protein PRUB_a2914 [Pseudoalteromonas rubra]|uniref:Polysaccharide biosynthesis protein n=1 Tax=Pseudoalteromonas rubra TaxID=43658 RepID=A0A8T0CC65_9GAMM|nr:polysaccharide biosynthesis protein [Pseudoalteromonas rubra]KAF7788289.1 hypothetical protein PRUB_a2914 [Pseudoalteromonas rubra]